jgi:signal transduction histidine kinase
MKIRTRLTLQFLIITVGILAVFSISIYYFSLRNQEDEFFMRMRNRALTSVKLLLEITNLDPALLKVIDQNTVNALYDEKILIYDHDNKLVYHHERSGTPLIVSTDIIDRARQYKEYRVMQSAQPLIGVLYEKANDKYVVFVSARDEQGTTQISYLKIVLIIGLVVSTGIVLLVGWLFAKQMLVPISNVVNKVERITAFNLNERVHAGTEKDEIAQLAATFNNMLERIEAAFEMQKRFVANASHELRTPLTAITGQIEVALLKKRDAEEYEETLRSVLEDTRNLGYLANGLLGMAQAKADAAEETGRPERIDELLWQTREELLKAHPEYKINILFNGVPEDERQLQVQGSEQLLRIAIGNLMDNGCKFSDNKQVDVFLTIDESIQLAFRDEGKGIPKDELKQIFQPFYRGSNGLNIPGHGLGLPLTEKIVRLYNGKIEVTSVPGKGTTFTLYFPHVNF